VKRLRQLEQQNGRLKKMVADRDLDIDVLKEIRRLRASVRPVQSPCVRLILGHAIDVGLSVAAGGLGQTVGAR